MAEQFPLPPNLPVPVDDGSCAHLTPGTPLPSPLLLQSCDGKMVDISSLSGVTVIYCYPMTGIPGVPLPEGWDLIPGARGCTPQSCSFKDHFQELRKLGVSHLFGLSTQQSENQKEAWERLHLPFTLLSDSKLEFVRALNLPTFKAEGIQDELVKRVTIVVKDGKIEKVFYPIFPPQSNAQDVVNWFKSNKN